MNPRNRTRFWVENKQGFVDFIRSSQYGVQIYITKHDGIGVTLRATTPEIISLFSWLSVKSL